MAIKAWRWQALTAVILFFLGVMLSVQFKAQQALSGALEYQSTESLVAMWRDLNTKKELLQKELGELRAKEATLAEQASQGKSAEENLRQELTRLRAVTGLAAVRGPGITITLGGNSPLLALDLVDLVNELWVSGAEAVAVNGQRITALSALGEAKAGEEYYLTLNGKRLYYPIVIEAIGDPDTLEKGLTFPGGLIDNFNTLYAIYPEIQKQEELVLPAAPPASWRYARPVAETANRD